jgi:hypothetical protein
MGEDEKEPGPDLSLGGNLEEALYKSHLPLNGAFAYSLNLPFSQHMHRLITLDCSTCRSKTAEIRRLYFLIGPVDLFCHVRR